MKTITTPIIPVKQTFANLKTPHTLNYEAICVFTAIGFFLDQDTYWKDKIALKPGTTYTLDGNGEVINSKENFRWHYKPRNISFKTAVTEFTDLFETIIKEQSGTNTVLLPLSGGLDSRAQAVALKHLGAAVHSYCYSFENGFKEHEIGRKIAEVCGFRYDPFIIPPNYLWDVIEEVSSINDCYSDFTHPRQIAVLDDFKRMQGEFSLGHWGDVFFDRGFAAADEKYSDLEIIYKKVVKKGGMAVASKLWKAWDLDGDFESYLKQRIQDLLDKIDIPHRESKVRAFKSLYWAPRWTSISLTFFENAHPIHLPYYDDRMCRFVCGIPEAYLADRKIQIAYIKNRNPNVAKIEWQDQMPYNLYNYKDRQLLKTFSYKVKNKMQREINAVLGKKYIQRNWELQFLGEENDGHLRGYLYQPDFLNFVGKDVVDDLYQKFKTKDAVFYSHSMSMLLTLSVWYRKLKTL